MKQATRGHDHQRPGELGTFLLIFSVILWHFERFRCFEFQDALVVTDDEDDDKEKEEKNKKKEEEKEKEDKTTSEVKNV